MSAKIGAARRQAFLKAFAQSGNVTLSAQQAGISRSWVGLARRADPAFDAACKAAKAEASARLAGGERNRPPRAWKQRGGVDLIVPRTGKRGAQVVRAPGHKRWTPRAEGRFLGQLRLCNNIAIACGAAGMTISSYEAHARRWPDFARRVREARLFASMRVRAAWKAQPFDFANLPADLRGPALAEMYAIVREHMTRSLK